ncbi:hypothetical protein M3Y99_00343800 [Aphelenchoides fujianensis]|nr:hypothetical protein M3Y99_00343800 [Aphelenchoides fujianensis]
MAEICWGMVCPATADEETTSKLREFGQWFTTKVHEYGLKQNQLYNFAEEPVFVAHLKGVEEEAADGLPGVYEELSAKNPHVSFVLHILPHKHSREFDKLKEVTSRLSLIGQGVLLENALAKFAAADEAAVFRNINQYIARRFAQIVDMRPDHRKTFLVVKQSVMPMKDRNALSYHAEDVHSTVCSVLHGERVLRMAKTQHESKGFRQTAMVCGLPEHYTRFQIANMFAPQPVASVLITSRGCAFVDFFEPDGPHVAKAHFDDRMYTDELSGAKYKISVCPIQSRFVRSFNPKEKKTAHAKAPATRRQSGDNKVVKLRLF